MVAGERFRAFHEKQRRERGVERYAREKGANLVTPELMEELRAKRFGTEKPVFKI